MAKGSDVVLDPKVGCLTQDKIQKECRLVLISQYHCISCVHRTEHTRSLHNILHFRLKERIGRKPNKSPSHVHQVRLPCPPVSPGARNAPQDLRCRRLIRTALSRPAGTVFERTIGARSQLAGGIGL